MHIVPAGLADTNAMPESDLPTPPRTNLPGGRPVSVDIADLSVGSVLGKGSFAVVSLQISAEKLERKRCRLYRHQTRLETSDCNHECYTCG